MNGFYNHNHNHPYNNNQNSPSKSKPILFFSNQSSNDSMYMDKNYNNTGENNSPGYAISNAAMIEENEEIVDTFMMNECDQPAAMIQDNENYQENYPEKLHYINNIQEDNIGDNTNIIIANAQAKVKSLLIGKKFEDVIKFLNIEFPQVKENIYNFYYI